MRWCSSRAARAREPNVRATTLELYDGLVAASQNCWPSVRFDVGAINNALSPLIPAGFYYKTFMWPPTPKWWLRYEHVIRRAAGMGRAALEPDPDHYEHQYAHCDVLVIGGGAAGLAAARAAAHAGARVIVCDENARWGGALPAADATIDGRPAARLDGRRVRAELARSIRMCGAAAHDGVRLLRRQSGRRGRTGRRPSAGAPAACPAAAVVEDPRAGRRARHRRDRARHRVRRTTTCRARCSPAPRARTSSATACGRGRAPSCSPTTTARTRPRSTCTRPASRSRAIVDARPAAALDGVLPARARAAGLPIIAASGDRRRARPPARRERRRRAAGRRCRAARSRAISCACPAASIRRCISSRRRAARCATTTRWRRSSPARRRCPSFPRARPMAHSAWPPH